MKKCSRCGRPEGEVHFGKQRNVCYSCAGKARRGTPDADAVDPLTEAYQTYSERAAFTTAKRQANALLEENLQLKATIGELGKLNRPTNIISYREAKAERADAVALVLASDWHVEEQVDRAAVHDLNEYNLDIAKQRAERFFQNALRLTNIMARETTIKTIYVTALGDFFSGWIHRELLASTLLAPGSAAHFVKQLWFSGIDFWLKESPYVIRGTMIPGNHGRMTEKMHFSDPAGTSLETFMYRGIVDRYYDNPRVQLKVSDHAMQYERFFERFNLRMIHGYEVNYQGGVGGITIPIRKALASWDAPIHADLTVLGHFHQFLDGGDFMVNGSMIGYNLYAQAIKARFEKPKQAFALIDARHGGEKSVVAPIWLDPSGKAAGKVA